jgi:hypothetical protein
LSHKDPNTITWVNRERNIQQNNPEKHKKKRKNNNINNTNTEHQQLVDGRTDDLRHGCQKSCIDGWKKVFYHGEPTVARVKAGCDPHAPTSESHLLARVDHTPV